LHPPTWDDWSRRASPLHRRDARAKVIALLLFLICTGTSTQPVSLLLLGAIVAVGVRVARVPVVRFLFRVLAIAPVPAVFAIVVWVSGHPQRAGILFGRSMLSVCAILLTVASTPVMRFFAALTWAKFPPLLVEVLQFVYRYLFVMFEEVWTLRRAAASRGGSGSLLAAVSAVAVLFARSYTRAEAIHRAMLSRNFSGILTNSTESRANVYDAVFVAGTAFLSIGSVAAPYVL
jgi:cobalt/nickel transport system permease protein